jgi:hypothetical protein
MRRGTFTSLGGAVLLGGGLSGCGRRSQPAYRVSEHPPSFAEAIASIRSVIARDAADPRILRAGLPRLYDHGKPATHAVVLFHGFTNCPQQFDELARRYHALGCNVYVPRIPHHGLKDRLTRDLAAMTVAEMQDSAAEAFALVRGLGSTVSAVGLSLGGSMALWLAQTQTVDLAVSIAPFLMPVAPLPSKPAIPPLVGEPAMRVLAAIPSMYWWWDPRVKEGSRPPYAYPGYPTHALAQMVFLGDAVVAEARKAKPRGRRCVVVLNDRDSAVNNGVTRDLLAIWNRHGAGYRELVLAGLGPPRHDIIDPTTYPLGRTAVYPKLEALVLGGGR